MSDTAPVSRVKVDGKFFRLVPEGPTSETTQQGEKFYVRGVTYGPFAPNKDREPFASREQTARDFARLRELGANVARVYYVPPRWFLDLALEHGLKVLVDIPWGKHLCFLDSDRLQEEACKAVRSAVRACGGHPAVFAFSVVNEISAEIVRWSGVRRVERFINELVSIAKNEDPGCLCTFASFPPTEFLQPEAIDFVCFNVYLHERKSFEGYLARLQTLADAKPLVLGEFGMDSFREGTDKQAEFLKWQIELAFRAGVAGTVVFSFTDDWFRGGVQIDDWGFGLTSRERTPKASFYSVQGQYHQAPHFPLPRPMKVSVVVATYNGGRTICNCLQALRRQNYSDYEVIVVDDGSTDLTPDLLKEYPWARYIRQTNQGLSVARNTGINAAAGDLVAFTDDDCRPDEDWLYYLVADLERGGFQGIGGHNFLPPDDSPVAAAVMVSPGGPAHVLITDREAEHIPGCNMAFYRSALEQIGGFDPVYRKAGDDVDICWRMQEAGFRVGFSPAGFVWHHRRSTVKAYLKQQTGYGEAEALLIRKHPEHYNSFGGGIWRGRIYAAAHCGLLVRGPVIYRGTFATGFFQRLYAPDPVTPLLLSTSFGYHVAINLPLMIGAAYFPVLIPVAACSLLASIASCALAAAQARLPDGKRRFWSRPLIGLLFFLQPIARGWARFKWSLKQAGTREMPAPAGVTNESPGTIVYWSDGTVERIHLLRRLVDVLQSRQWKVKTDTGWTDFDLEIPAHLWTRLRLTTVGEELEMGKRVIRCRVAGGWSLPAKLLFTGAVLLCALLIERLAGVTPWIWFLLPLLPLTAWWLDDEAHVHAAGLATVVEEVSQELRLVKTPETGTA